MTIENLTNPNLVYQIGIEPNRIDILMGVGGLSFEQAWKTRKVSSYGEEKVYLLDRGDLIRAKRAAGRLQDQLDLQLLSNVVRKKIRRRLG